ncbi:protein CASC3 isoform X2 [Diachasma alloeum]|uniref:protein CASC3 isoform X2 n=1 Tax=Diachasma alloeum TaxID=454923 RepID=UPI0007382261|nr:protein CASC3 isoform X2 [Diachasma alloeum]
MSDTRRRRKSDQSGGSEDLSESYEELNATKETQMRDRRTMSNVKCKAIEVDGAGSKSSEQIEVHHDSEYDTAGSDGESEGGSQDGGQRESGDGQEEDKPQKKLDDDEDRRNPQYIPKRGTFYEHDDRTAEEATESTVEQPPERDNKEKKVWREKEDRWDHDRYNDEEQAPKSHEELIAVYGYDIRNEEGPPRARRRRRYGRGPNKYTRNWEDEDAYGKTSGNNTSTKHNRRSNRGGEEFPALRGFKDEPETPEEPVISSAWYTNKNKSQTKQPNFPPLQPQQDNQKNKSTGAQNDLTNENKAPNEPTNPAWKKDAKYTSQSLSPSRNIPHVEPEKIVYVKQNHANKRQVQESVSLAASRARGRGFKPSGNNNVIANRTVENKGPKGRGGGVINNDNIRRNNSSLDEEQIVNDIKHMTVNDGSGYHHQGRPSRNFYAPPSNQQRPNVPPPRMQQPPPQQPSVQQQAHPQSLPDVAGNRPKRYSSLRQRPVMPEGPVQPTYPQQHAQHNQHGYYPPQAGNTHGVLDSQGHYEQPPPVPTTVAPMGGQPVMPLPPGGQPAPYAPPPFLVPPPQFIPSQTAPPNIINYVSAPNGPPFQPNFQGYQGYNPNVQPQGPPPPPELFQPQGCTYYNPAQQPPQQQQAAPVRRPKAAIPILPPPDNSQYHQGSRGRGRSITQTQQNPTSNIQSFEDPTIDPTDLKQKFPPETFENSQLEGYDSPPDHVTQSESKETAVIEGNAKSPEISEVEVERVEAVVEAPETDKLTNVVINDEKVATSVDITVGETAITKVESVVHENHVVEEAAA